MLLDPPRSGLDPEAIKAVISLNPREIAYVSCNPKTQRENADHFIRAGYEIVAVQPVDQFPHTAHIENIVIFKRSVIKEHE